MHNLDPRNRRAVAAYEARAARLRDSLYEPAAFLPAADRDEAIMLGWIDGHEEHELASHFGIGEMTIHWMLQSLFGKVLPSRNSARATIADALLREVQVCA